MPYAVNQSHIELLRHAQRFSKRADEAEDLLQEVLLAAIEAGRSDLSDPNNRRWMVGALRKRALFEARTAGRRKIREASYVSTIDRTTKAPSSPPFDFVSTLSKSLRTTALLVLTGHTKQEIIYLLRISDGAFRKRISSIRKKWSESDGVPFDEIQGLDSSLPLGKIRQALLKPAKSEDVHLASHDPDGNLFLVCSQKSRSRQLLDTNSNQKK